MDQRWEFFVEHRSIAALCRVCGIFNRPATTRFAKSASLGRFRCDNGEPFIAARAPPALLAFDLVGQLGIRVEHIALGEPQ